MNNTFFRFWLPASLLLHAGLLTATTHIVLFPPQAFAQPTIPIVVMHTNPPRRQPVAQTATRRGNTPSAPARGTHPTTHRGTTPNRRPVIRPAGPLRNAEMLSPGMGMTPASGITPPRTAAGLPPRGLTHGGGDGNPLPALGNGGERGEWIDRPGGGGDITFGDGRAMPGSGVLSGGSPVAGGGRGDGMPGGMGHAVGALPGGTGGRDVGRYGNPGGPDGIPGGVPGATGTGTSLGRDVGGLRISTAGIGPRGDGGWGDRPDGVGGPGGGGTDLAPARPSYGAAALGGPAPNYPSLAEKEGLEGSVVVDVTVGGDGTVVKVKVSRPSKSDALDNEALRTARKWNYRAAMANGSAVNGHVKLEITFELGKTPAVKPL